MLRQLVLQMPKVLLVGLSYEKDIKMAEAFSV